MSTFEVSVVRVTGVEDHPNADRLSLINFRGYTTISAKLDDGGHRYAVGDLVVYVPEQAIVPDALLRDGFWDPIKDRPILGGSNYNRVKAIKLRGVVSQGIMFPVDTSSVVPNGFEGAVFNGSEMKFVAEGDDVAEHLGIVKYEPALTPAFRRLIAGNVFDLGTYNTISFDLDNFQKYPFLLDNPEEEIVLTEKLHGTNCQVAYLPGHSEHVGFLDRPLFVGSKGQSAKGLMFKNDHTSEKNVYVDTTVRSGIAERFMDVCDSRCEYFNEPCYLLGEVIGEGVQDLGYGESAPTFRAFGMYVGKPRGAGGRWLDRDEFEDVCAAADIPMAPVVARGKWGAIEPKLSLYRDGKTVTDGNHIREGVVIVPAKERNHFRFGRVALKHVSPDYLTRKGNVTEFA
jgi:RNA ligase (TIGR02306 family)